MSEPECFFAHLGGCEGRLVKAHLVPKQTLRRELVMYRIEEEGEGVDADIVIWDPRCWRPMCGGPTGIGGHHGAYDAYQIRLHAWPEDFLEFLREYDIGWMAERYATESSRRTMRRRLTDA
jgi:hypothetical protein